MVEFSNSDLFLVTGAGSGIGKAIAMKIVELGGRVVGVGRNEERLAALQECLGEKFCYELRDLSADNSALPAWLGALSKKYGQFRGLALAAGIQETRPISILNEEKLIAMFETNLYSNLFLIKGFAKKSVRASDACSCVVISSLASECGIPGIVGYSASKGALNSAVKALAAELARDEIRINAVLPGHIETEMLTKGSKFYNEEYVTKLRSKYPLGLGKPEDVANMTCFLLSSASSWVTGGNFIIDGGAGSSF